MTSVTLHPVTDDDATLRMLAREDLPATLEWRNDSRSRRWFHSTDLISEDQHREWFARYLERANDYMFILEVGGVPVAQVSLYDVADNSAEFGRLLVDPTQRGRGLSHRAIALSLRVADQELALSRVHLEVKRDNVPAIRAYESAGFIRDESHMGTDDSVVMVREKP